MGINAVSDLRCLLSCPVGIIILRLSALFPAEFRSQSTGAESRDHGFWKPHQWTFPTSQARPTGMCPGLSQPGCRPEQSDTAAGLDGKEAKPITPAIPLGPDPLGSGPYAVGKSRRSSPGSSFTQNCNLNSQSRVRDLPLPSGASGHGASPPPPARRNESKPPLFLCFHHLLFSTIYRQRRTYVYVCLSSRTVTASLEPNIDMDSQS